MAVAAGLFVVMVLLAERVMGYDFLGAIGWNTYEAPEASLPTTPWLHLLTQTLTRGNILLDLIIGVGFALWTWYWIGGCMLYATRHAFAWSFDRVMPKALGKVSSRYHTPVNSIILCAVVAEISLALYCFTEWFNTLVGIFAMTFMFFFVGISAIVFPYVRRELFESSPMNYRIFGIPLVSIFGLLTSIFMAYMLYCFYYDDVAAGNNLPSLIAVFGPMIIAFIYYFVAQGIRKSREGIDVSYTFKEIPVE
jgi:amino acid transporter